MSDESNDKRRKIDYANGKIYKIVNTVNGMVYIGSTTQPLSKRMVQHRSNAKRLTHRPLYHQINEHGIDMFSIILLHAFPCKNIEELVAEEYRVMATFAKDLLLNLMQDGKHAKEAVARMREHNARSNKGKFAEASCSFNRGSISCLSTRPVIQFMWREQNHPQIKTFCFGGKRTREQAYLCCWELREKIFPLSNKDYLDELTTMEL